MTNKEAIETLRANYPDDCYEQLREAVDIAINALIAQPEETHEERTEMHACDCVSRQTAIDAMWEIRQEEISDGRRFHDYCSLSTAVDVIKDLPSAQPEPQWIPVSERLPEPRVDVWVNSDIGQIQGYYEEHIGIWYASFGQGRDYLELIVTAWMPLPEPYKAERRTDG